LNEKLKEEDLKNGDNEGKEINSRELEEIARKLSQDHP